jgi:hypothetical protein
MLTFKQFITEASEYKNPADILNKSQLKAMNKHPHYSRYVHSYEHPTVHMRLSSRNDPKSSIRDVAVANSGQKHYMEFAISKRGKIFHSTVYKHEHTDEKGNKTWGIAAQHSVDD